ncbi:hypothetical protein, partial [Lysobacter sp. ISL-52]|uniref:hypothetical protein n=1 Tax=Lysobacter sp. ISL-52 TaxID=2819154 RepID=UPI001BE65925
TLPPWSGGSLSLSKATKKVTKERALGCFESKATSALLAQAGPAVGILPTAGPGARPCAPPSGCPWSRELLAAPSNGNNKKPKPKQSAAKRSQAKTKSRQRQRQRQRQQQRRESPRGGSYDRNDPASHAAKPIPINGPEHRSL